MLLFSEESIFDRGGEERRAVLCSDAAGEKNFYIDSEHRNEVEDFPLRHVLRVFDSSAT